MSNASGLQAEQQRRDFLRAQHAALLAGRPQEAPRTPTSPALEQLNTRPPVDRLEAIKALGLYRKSVKARPVPSGYTPTTTFFPIMFPYNPAQNLTKLSRSVSREWRQLLTSVSTTSLAGGRLTGAQGRNLIRIVEELRKHCFLQVDEATGRPVKVREQVVHVVDGGQFCFAAQCDMSPATFYRALGHPLAHLWIRTQKVQRTAQDGAARRNAATLFSVALFEPVIPEDIEAAFWAQSVDTGEVFTVPDYNSQNEGTKERPVTTQKQNEACGKLTDRLRGSFAPGPAGVGKVLAWVDSAGLASRAGNGEKPLDLVDTELKGCIDRLRETNPELWEFAVSIAIYHDDEETRAYAALGYFKALVHLGVPRVRYWVQRIERWTLKGQKISTPGKLLTHHLSQEARKVTGFPLRDLGTEPGAVTA